MLEWLRRLLVFDAPLREEDQLPSFSYADVFADLPRLETKRLLLRPMKLSDSRDIFAYSADPEVARHVLWEAHTSLFQAREYLRYVLRQYRRGEPSSYGIVDKALGRVVGTIGFMWLSPENRSAEVGYSLARDHWNCGYMTEALSAVVDMGFRTLKLHRIEAQHETDNPASGRVMVKCGMKYEGTLRGRIFNKGRYSDVALYAILREDWVARHPGER